jgi:hypothetical protein
MATETADDRDDLVETTPEAARDQALRRLKKHSSVRSSISRRRNEVGSVK